jgi:penicillin-binding protein 1A
MPMRFVRLFFALIFAAILIGATVGATFLVRWARELPDYRELDQLQLAGTTRVYASDNALISVIVPTVGSERFDRRPAKLGEINALMIAAVVASEDADFFKHYGFDPIGIARSLFQTFIKDNAQGGSTITQQLIRSTLIRELADDRSRTVERKIKELMLSVQAERYFTKEELLADYLNSVFWGGNIRGVRAAAQAYFGKDPLELTLGESVYMTSLLPSPNDFFAPRDNAIGGFKRVRAGMKLRLARLVEGEWVTQKDADAAWLEKVQPRGWKVSYDGKGGIKDAKLIDPKANKVQEIRTEFATHFMYEIRKILKAKFPDNKIYSGGGLRVFTTLDTRAQRAAELAITRGRTPGGSASEAAAVMMNPYTGEIMAMVGGKDVGGKDEFNRAAAAKFKRSPGSSIKPLLFATALDAGIQQWDTFLDANVRINAPGTSCFGQEGVWCPKNFDGPALNSNKNVSLRYALDHSLNLPTIRVLQKIGRERFRDKLRQLGFTDVENEIVWSSAIGGGINASPLKMAAAYASFVNGGFYIEPRYIKRIEDSDGKVLYPQSADDEPVKRRVWSPQIAFVALDMIRGVVNDPPSISPEYAKDAKIGNRQVAGKTGTSSNVVDMWFVGSTPEAVGAVWIGRDDNKGMGERYFSGEWNPKIWRDMVSNALIGRPPQTWQTPEYIGYKEVQGVKMAYAIRQTNTGTVSSFTPDPEPVPYKRPAVDGPQLPDEAQVTLALDVCQRNRANVNPWADETTSPNCVSSRSVKVSELSFYDPNYTPPVVPVEPDPIPVDPSVDPNAIQPTDPGNGINPP